MEDIKPKNTREEMLANQRFKAGQKHMKPSEKTLEKFDKQNDKIDKLSEIMHDYCTSVAVLSNHFEKGGIVVRIEDHVMETNGKVALNTKWRNYLIAGGSVILFLFPVMTGVFMYFMNDLRRDMGVDITAQVQAHEINYNEEFDSKVVDIIEKYDWEIN